MGLRELIGVTTSLFQIFERLSLSEIGVSGRYSVGKMTDELTQKACACAGAGGNVSDDIVGRRADILQKIEACAVRIRVTQARINGRNVAALDTDDDEKWIATELDLLSILVGLLKGLMGRAGSE